MNHAALNLNYDKSILQNAISKGEFQPTNLNDNDRFITFNKVVSKEVKQHISDAIAVPGCVYELLFFSNPPNDHCDPHIDLGRRCSINFPINVPGEIYTAKDSNSEYFRNNRTEVNDAISFPPIGDDNKHHYNKFILDETPVLLNTKAAHAVFNRSPVVRYIASLIIVTHDFDQLLNIFKQRGQVINTV